MRRTRRSGVVWIAVAIFQAGVSAQDDDGYAAPSIKETVREVKESLAKGDLEAAREAFARAEAVRADHKDKQLEPLARAIAAGGTHKDTALALAALETLGRLKVAGTAKMLGKALAPPPQVPEDRLVVFQAAIAAAGQVRDADSMKALEKLLGHLAPGIATAAAEALGGFKSIDTKQRRALAGRLVKVLADQEKRIQAAKTEEAKANAESLRSAVAASLGSLMNKDGLATADDWTKWLREEAKRG